MSVLKIHIAALITAVFTLLTTAAYGQNASQFCSVKDTVIYFGNGVWTDRPLAKIDLEQFKNEISTVFPAEQFDKISFDLAFNTSSGKLADLFESAIQDLSGDASSFWRTIAILVPMPATFRAKLTNLAATIDENAFLNSQDLSIQLASYRNTILEGKKALVVSHSQGNFFANESYRQLSTSDKASFGIVSVANPASSVTTGGPHTTLYEDLVIQAITAAKLQVGLPTPQLPNVTNLLTLADLTGHFFVESYLAPNSDSRTKILNDVVSVRSSLQQPPSTAGQGIITVTLTWGAQQDVDLHAFEPNGAHVYYAHRFGPSGYLDVDDVTSFGPEHYFVGCNTLEAGTYRIGVNYFSGSAPEVASVLIQAGLKSKGFTVFLPSAIGLSGNASPASVGTISVTGTPQGGFSFDIQ